MSHCDNTFPHEPGNDSEPNFDYLFFCVGVFVLRMLESAYLTHEVHVVYKAITKAALPIPKQSKDVEK